jgi:hypothetical protein
MGMARSRPSGLQARPRRGPWMPHGTRTDQTSVPVARSYTLTTPPINRPALATCLPSGLSATPLTLSWSA